MFIYRMALAWMTRWWILKDIHEVTSMFIKSETQDTK